MRILIKEAISVKAIEKAAIDVVKYTHQTASRKLADKILELCPLRKLSLIELEDYPQRTPPTMEVYEQEIHVYSKDQMESINILFSKLPPIINRDLFNSINEIREILYHE